MKRLRVDGRDGHEAAWLDPLHIATDTFRAGVVAKLSRDPELADDVTSIALAEIYLSEQLPDIHEFHGIFDVDDVGIWYYDGGTAVALALSLIDLATSTSDFRSSTMR